MSRVNAVVLVLVSLVATSSLLAQGDRRTRGFAAAAPGPATVNVTSSAAGAAVTWSETAGAAHYVVLRGADSASLAAVSSPLTITSFVDGGLAQGATAYYQVAAIYPDGGRGVSAVVAYTAPTQALASPNRATTALPLAPPAGATFAPPTAAPALQNPSWAKVVQASSERVWDPRVPPPPILTWTYAQTYPAAQTYPKFNGIVDLAWDVPQGASTFLVKGPGLPSSGSILSGNAVRLFNVPAGPQTWRVMTANSLADTATPAVATMVVRPLPSHSPSWLSKPFEADHAAAVKHSNVSCGDGAPACGRQTMENALRRLGRPKPLVEVDGVAAFYANRTDFHASRATVCEVYQIRPVLQQGTDRTVCWTSTGRVVTMIAIDPAGAQFLAFGLDDARAQAAGHYADELVQEIQTALDSDGPKYLPFSCISCHGGTYDPATGLVKGSTLLPIDPNLVAVAVNNHDVIRSANALIAASSASPSVRRYIHGLYNGQVSITGAAAVPDYVPHSWRQQNRSFYLDVLRKNCVMCHLNGPPNLDFTTASNFFANRSLIHRSVCTAKSMPHAEVPFKRFWTEDTGNIYLPGFFATLLGFPSC